MKRAPKPRVFEDAIISDRGFTEAIRGYINDGKNLKKQKAKEEHAKEINRKREEKKAQEEMKRKAAELEKKKKAEAQQKKIVQKPAAVPLTAQQKRRKELEDAHIARHVYPNNSLKKSLPSSNAEFENMEAAVERGFRQCTKPLLDWSSQPAKFIGKLCKVYWDGDKMWFYGRVLNYDSRFDRYQVS